MALTTPIGLGFTRGPFADNEDVVAEGFDYIVSDSDSLKFGDAEDVALSWDGTNLNILPVADDTGSIIFGDGTTDMDVKVILSATTKYALFDVGNALLQLEDVDLKLGDNDEVQFGDATGGDVSFTWNATKGDNEA